MELDLREWMEQRSGGSMLAYALLRPADIQADTLTCTGGFFVMVVAGGTAALSCPRCEGSLIRQDDLLVLTPSMEIELYDMDADFQLSCVYFFPDFFDTLSAAPQLYDPLAKFVAAGILPLHHLDEEASQFMQTTASLFHLRPDTSPLHREGMLRSLSSFYLMLAVEAFCRNHGQSAAQVSHPMELYRHFRKLLHRHYRTEHNIAFYAGQLCISTTYLSRVVKQLTGRTVHSHLAGLLCADARKYLIATDLNIKEIADKLGFSSQSSFSKFFQKRMKMSPQEFRLRKET